MICYVFFISIPFCIAAFIMVAMFIEDPPYIKNAIASKFDYLGMIFLILWIATFQVMVDNGQKNGWFDSPYIMKLGVTSLIAFIGLVYPVMNELHVMIAIVPGIVLIIKI